MSTSRRTARAPPGRRRRWSPSRASLLLLFAVLELANLASGRVTMGCHHGRFFLAYGVGLLVCAWALSRGQSWARSPVVLAQLIQLGVAWSFRGGGTTGVAIALAVVAAGRRWPACSTRPASKRSPTTPWGRPPTVEEGADLGG